MSSVYKRISMNIYKEYDKFRVRYSKKGKRISKSFAKKEDALAYRKKVLGI